MEKSDRLLKIIREMMAVGAGGYTSSGDPKIRGGFDTLISFQRRGKLDYRKVPKKYKDWVKSMEKSNARFGKNTSS